MHFRIAALTSFCALALTACSDSGDEARETVLNQLDEADAAIAEEEEAANNNADTAMTPEQLYPRAVDCVGVFVTIERVATVRAEVVPENAEPQMALAADARQFGERFSRISGNLGRSTGVSENQALSDIQEDIQSRSARIQAEGVDAGARSLGREADVCVRYLETDFAEYE